MRYVGTATYQFMPCYVSVYTQTHAHTHRLNSPFRRPVREIIQNWNSESQTTPTCLCWILGYVHKSSLQLISGVFQTRLLSCSRVAWGKFVQTGTFGSHARFETRFCHTGSTNTSSLWFVDTFDQSQTSIQHNHPC